jgi:hypothetical protein
LFIVIDTDQPAQHAQVQIESTIQTVSGLPIELDFNAEAAYSIDDDPFHYDWPFW